MLSLEQTVAAQENLEALCADRPLVTNELFSPNAFYGMDLILKEYARLPPAYPLKAVIPHGICLSDTYMAEDEKLALLPAVLIYSPYRERIFALETKKLVLKFVSPFLYLVELMKQESRPPRNGTIFFLYHSSHHVTVNMDLESLAEQLLKLDREYQPVTMCIYWRDFLLGKHIPFKRRGIRIVSAGHIYDHDFLYRFYHLCSTHRYAASNEVGSNLFYSVKSGCSFFLFERGDISFVADSPEYEIPPQTNLPAELRLLFSKPVPDVTKEQMQVVDYHLGSRYLKSPEALRRQLRHLDFLDRFGFLVWNKGMLPKLGTPAKYRRHGGFLRFQRKWFSGKLSGLERRVRQVLQS